MTLTETSTVIDPGHFRTVLGHFPTGVVAITSTDSAGLPVGMAVGSFTSVSLDPALVAFLPDKSSSTFPKIRESGRFCVNVLGAGQQDICRSLALKGSDKFASIDWTPTQHGNPRIHDSIAWIDCVIDTIHEAGDHFVVIGRVASLEVDDATSPLIFFQGGYGCFSSTSLTAPGEADLLRPLSIVDQARPEMEAVARELGVECCASVAIRDQLVLVGSSMASTLPTSPHIRLGQRMPFVPPLALPLMAWAEGREFDKWIGRGGQALDRDLLVQATSRVRDRGWSLVLRSDAQVRFEGAVARLPLTGATGDLAGDVTAAARALSLEGYEPAEIDPAATYDVRIISAPIFGADAQPELLLSLYQLPSQLSGAEVERYRDRLLTAAETVTTKLGGSKPPTA
ncbi:NADH-FMN oxidoreductase [Rhodococcus wratislaviensis]|uniref:NADH-FMN oxidoreductase n=1 Tax=Rhodococcus wratislaviensis TaxID=44752 RepID=A0A402CLS2_RHOWR|nr:flavin reductase [Rhodococcus wratislaviensis]GCE44600.1 NADH-FMN oxidoreductase [Rhodococcus wratislaviensis]